MDSKQLSTHDGKKMSQVKALIAPFLVVFALGGCASVQVHRQVLQGEAPLRPSLGVISLRPETRWRADQKEPKVREKIALAAIGQAFRDLPNGRVAETRPISPWTQQADLRLDEAKKAGIDTIIVITVEELGPRLYLSVPVLWSTYSDVKFELRAIKTFTGETLLDVNYNRLVGGPFQLRGLWPLQAEMEFALREVMGLTN